MDPVIERVIDQRDAEDRTGPLAQRVAQVTACQQRIALQGAVGASRIILGLIDLHIVIIEGVARHRRNVFGHRNADAGLEAGGRLTVDRVAVRIEVVEAVEIAPIDVHPQADVAIEQIGFGKADIDLLGILRVGQIEPDRLAAAAEVALFDRALENQLLKA